MATENEWYTLDQKEGGDHRVQSIQGEPPYVE